MAARLVTILLVLSLGGCASSPTTFDPSHSFAWNVADAAGWDVDDLDRGELEDPDIVNKDGKLVHAAKTTGAMAAVVGAGSYAMIGSTALALEQLVAAGPTLGIFFLATAFEPDGVAEQYQTLAWMPDDGNQDEDAAMRDFIEMQFDSLRELPAPYKSRAFREIQKEVNLIAPDYYVANYAISGGLCSEDGVDCAWQILAHEPERGTSPPWLGGKPSFVFFKDTSFGAGAGPRCSIKWGVDSTRALRKIVEQCQNDLNMLEASITAEKPEWFYVYWPDFSKSLPLPLLANQGEVYLFVSPQ